MQTHIARDLRLQKGKALRQKVPRSKVAGFQRRPTVDPQAILEAQAKGRLPHLRAIRRARMAASPFAYLRGAAAVMAADLAGRPVTGLRVQTCGDAHIANFGGYASPERHLIFDLNDFDETLPGPWEWDLQRLVASLAVAGRGLGLSRSVRRDCTLAAAARYRQALRELTTSSYLDVWYQTMSAGEILGHAPPSRRRVVARSIARAERRTSKTALAKLATWTHAGLRIREKPPLLTHEGMKQGSDEVRDVLLGYRRSLPATRRVLLDRYTLIDVALKVVGVGSVGTRCFVALLLGDGEDDPLFLQVKEANESVLARNLGVPPSVNEGQRVVRGQRLLQAASDVLLGWTHVDNGRDFYVRQLRDMKASADFDSMDADTLEAYAGLCGETLARAHARSGPFSEMAGYVGSSEVMDESLASFAEAYADQTERDHAALTRAIRTGRLAAEKVD